MRDDQLPSPCLLLCGVLDAGSGFLEPRSIVNIVLLCGVFSIILKNASAPLLLHLSPLLHLTLSHPSVSPSFFPLMSLPFSHLSSISTSLSPLLLLSPFSISPPPLSPPLPSSSLLFCLSFLPSSFQQDEDYWVRKF